MLVFFVEKLTISITYEGQFFSTKRIAQSAIREAPTVFSRLPSLMAITTFHTFKVFNFIFKLV